GEICATYRVIVLTVHRGRQVQEPRITGISCITDHPVVIRGGGVAAEVIFAVHRGIAVVHGRTHTPGVAKGAIGTEDQPAEFRTITAHVVGTVLTGITAERLAPD